jgi:hypothetical protein
VLRLGHALALGTEPVATVPRFNLWTLGWNARHLPPFGAYYWDAPIFFPTKGAFAFSEPQPLTGAVFAVLRAVGCSQTAAYAVVLLGALTLNGVATARLLDLLGVAFVPGTFAGALAVGLPFVVDELGVLQLTMLWPFVFALGAVVRCARRPRLRSAAALGGWLIAMVLTCEYYTVFGFTMLAVVGAAWLTSRGVSLTRPAFVHGVVAGAVTLSVVPIVLAQSSRVDQFAWSETTVEHLGASARDWLRVNPRAWGASVAPWLAVKHEWQLALFPGIALIALGTIGLVAGLPSRRRTVSTIVLSALVAMVLAGGLGVSVFGWQPLATLRSDVPGFARLRSPFRFAVVVQVCLVLLAGFGLDWLWRRRHRAGRGIAVAVTVLALLEGAQLPARTAPALEGLDDDWVAWLAARPAGPVAMVPFPIGPSARDYAATTEAMLLSLKHHHVLVNGYSGFFPARYVALRIAMRDFPDARTVGALRRLGVRWIVVENRWLVGTRPDRMVDSGFDVVPAFRGERRSVYAMAITSPGGGG